MTVGQGQRVVPDRLQRAIFEAPAVHRIVHDGCPGKREVTEDNHGSRSEGKRSCQDGIAMPRNRAQQEVRNDP